MSIFKLYINLLKTKNQGSGCIEYGTGLFYMKVLDHNINSKFCRVVMIYCIVCRVCESMEPALIKKNLNT